LVRHETRSDDDATGVLNAIAAARALTARRARARGDERLAMDNKARMLKSMFRQKAEQRGLPSGSAARPAKAARREAPAAPSGAGPSSASRGAGGPPPGFFDSDVPPRSGSGGASAPTAPAPAPAPAPAAPGAGVPSGFFDAPAAPAPAPAPAASPEARGALALVMGGYGDSDEDADEPSSLEAPPSLNPGATKASKGSSVPDDSFFDSKAKAAAARGDKAKPQTAEEALKRFEEDVRADVEEATRREQEEMEAEALEKVRREAEEHAERLASIARLKKRAEEKRAEAARRREEEKATRDDAGAEPSRESDSESEEPFPGGTEMDWRAKRV
jgi:hypothetical protein